MTPGSPSTYIFFKICLNTKSTNLQNLFYIKLGPKKNVFWILIVSFNDVCKRSFSMALIQDQFGMVASLYVDIAD